MRIIAGTARGRRIEAPDGKETRPTLDRVRENLFNILQTRIQSSVVLDLFAGSGALSLEALSRGAERAVMCDLDRNAHRTEKHNAELLGFSDRTEMMCCDWKTAARKLKEREEKFDLVFLDPPYRMTDLREVFESIEALLEEDALVIRPERALSERMNENGASAVCLSISGRQAGKRMKLRRKNDEIMRVSRFV